ncbi:MAG: selenide, water dikinase SelD [Boseongicola sp. SB0664_bin_43]|uniref:Selenide, water dikinase SelD n=1 Tax=Boseongicola sp. SB0664_bin_43 TaxID=2604844 RepID=A0A6B0Y522_9RHOB|nr:selenide, water dikinase SelD [Boseongicola sp. SB0664_bin_43]
MHALPLPLTKEVVLIGGGHTHALLLRSWGMNPLPGARLTVINPCATAPYTGMLPGFVAGHYRRDALEIDLVRLARFAGARMIFGHVTGIDRTERALSIKGRAPVAYDVASLDIGITSDMPELPGFSEHGIAAKPLGPFATRWTRHLEQGEGPVTVIGGGVAGTELAMAMRHVLGSDEIRVVEADVPLAGIGRHSRAKLLAELSRQGIELIQNNRVSQVLPDAVVLDDGRELPTKLTVGAAGARPFPWLENTGLDLKDGYVTVGATLQSTKDPAIFAVGDCAHLEHAPRPKAGVFAVRAAPVLTANLRAAVSGTELSAFRPQSHYLKLVSLGRKTALADKWGMRATGDWVWRWKDRIDRVFMDKLNALPKMKTADLPGVHAEGVDLALGPKPLCTGCGSKIGSGVLDSVLADLPEHHRADVELGPGDDAAILGTGETRQAVSTDHLRAFWNDPWLFARISALHALGDVWAMGAEPQAAFAQVTLPPLAEDLQRSWLFEILHAASEVFRDAGASLAGGHSTIGAELVIGFAVTGLTRGKAITLAGAQVGHALLLTRPIGSGTILAGEMAGDAKGDDVAAALRTMATAQGDAARLLAGCASAMTDVTGFGLAGHLGRMAEASGLTARITLQEIPIYEGAESLCVAGTRSSIWPANRAAASIAFRNGDRGDLLFDPQTAGGLLAALPPDDTNAVLRTVRDMGHDARIIGTFESRSEVTVQVD